MIINVIDMVDGAGKYQKEDLVKMKNKHFVELPLMSNGLQEMKTRIMKLADFGSIEALRVFGHGGPGVQSVALGKCSPNAMGNSLSAISINSLNTLAELGLYFTKNARAELRGCGVASDGGLMISALSKLWRVRVQATTAKKQMGHIFWDHVVEVRPGSSRLYPIHPAPLKQQDQPRRRHR